MKRFGSTKQGRFIVICCSIVVLMLVMIIYYPLGYTRLEPTELGEFIDSRNDLWPQLFSDFYSVKGNITRFDGIFSKNVRLIFSHSSLSHIFYDSEQSVLKCYFKEFFRAPETSCELQYNSKQKLTEIDQENRNWESEWKMEELSDTHICWEHGNQYIYIQEIRPHWFFIYRYLPT